jgi:hypothetical protein
LATYSPTTSTWKILLGELCPKHGKLTGHLGMVEGNDPHPLR